MSRRPIQLRSIGTLSPLGASLEAAQASLDAGQTRLRVASVDGAPTAVGPLSADAEQALQAFLTSRPRYAELDRSVQLATCAARSALDRAGWSQAGAIVADRGLGVFVGSSRGATSLLERHHGTFRDGDGRVPVLTSPTTTLGNLSNWVAQEAYAGGPSSEISSTCSTTLYALGDAVAWLRAGMVRRALAGGTEAPLTPFTVAQMRAVRVYSRDVDAPLPCRPLALDGGRRNTMVLAEGAGILALDGEPSGPRLATILGVGFAVEPILTNTSLSDDGAALQQSMRRALDDAELETVDAVVTHTPGTAKGDAAEWAALRALFDDDLPHIAFSKWITGHALGAAGALSILHALHLLRGGRAVAAPYDTIVPATARALRAPARTVLVNSVGFGGNAASIVLTA